MIEAQPRCSKCGMAKAYYSPEVTVCVQCRMDESFERGIQFERSNRKAKKKMKGPR